MKNITALVYPCYSGDSIFDIIDNTNLLEGDAIRLFRQVIDRIGQIRNATKDKGLMTALDKIEKMIDTSMCDIDVI